MKREPLVIRGAIVAALTALLHVLAVMGVLHLDAETEKAIGGLIDLFGTAVLVLWARGAVTPAADPRDSEGEPMVPADVMGENP